jgi:hypothetical protein
MNVVRDSKNCFLFVLLDCLHEKCTLHEKIFKSNHRTLRQWGGAGGFRAGTFMFLVASATARQPLAYVLTSEK